MEEDGEPKEISVSGLLLSLKMGKITGYLCAKDSDLDKRGNLMVQERFWGGGL